jgi:hypothetical protein
MVLGQYEQVEAAVKRVETKVTQEVAGAPDPFVAEALTRLHTIPGIVETVAQIIVAEVGLGMSQFPSTKYLAS